MDSTVATPRERGYLGSAFRLTLDLIDNKGWRDRIRAEAPPETARMMDKPPSPLSWIPAARLEDLEDLVEKHGGRDAACELGLLGIRRSLFDVTRGNLQYVLELCGASGDVGAPQIVRHDDRGALVRFNARWA